MSHRTDRARRLRPSLEALEDRQLCSWGFSARQLQHAYGLDQAARRYGPAARGAGVTVAVVVAYDSSTVARDLAVYSRANHLPPANLAVVNLGAAPGSAAAMGWAEEASIDVEMVHALAPLASIVLVEAPSGDYAGFTAAEACAAAIPGVGVVTASWNGSEADYRSTPQPAPWSLPNITFVTSSGDSRGPNYPATYPDVVAVGATSGLGRRSHAVGWSGGGLSAYQPTPPYQLAMGYPARSTPDVVMAGVGVACYQAGWWPAQGTSVSAPLFAGLAAALDGVRLARGEAPIGTAALLAGMYSHPGVFTAIAGGSPASTGLGSPWAPGLVAALG